MLDELDKRLLRELQADASRSIVEIAERVHLSHNACWRRIRRLEEGGVITRRVALVDFAKVGLPLTAFVTIRAHEHTEAWLETFASAVRRLPEVMEFYRLSGETDYLLKLSLSDVSAYDGVYKRLLRIAPLADVSASFAMEEIKLTTAAPIP